MKMKEKMNKTALYSMILALGLMILTGTKEINAATGKSIQQEEQCKKQWMQNQLEKKESVSYPKESLIEWDDSWNYAEMSAVHGDTLKLTRPNDWNGFVVAVNAGHGSLAAAKVKTFCHPDRTSKVTGGSTGAGETKATGANSGTAFLDGTSEAEVVLQLARIVRDDLLERGYGVLMIRDAEDCNLDNIARTVFANNQADCHIALHYAGSENDKGFYYTSVPDIASYKKMEPVASHWQEHNNLGEAILSGVKEEKIKIWESGSLGADLTQTSYSEIPSVDLEVGDRGSDHSEATLQQLSKGIVQGIDHYFSSRK